MGEKKEGGSFVGGSGGATAAKKRGSSIFGGVTTLRGPLEKWLGDDLLVSDAQSLVAGPVLRPTGETGLRDMGYIGIYFGGAWSPPCRSFVPKLEKACAEINSRGKVFEVVYAGTDMEKADLVEMLLAAGADPSAKNPTSGVSPRELAELFADAAVLEALVRWNTDASSTKADILTL